MRSELDKYTAEVDTHDKNQWHKLVQHFEGVNIYQTWSYAGIFWGEDKLSHMVIKHNREIVAAAQVVIVRVPLVNAGIAHVKFGPLWRLKGKTENPKHYEAMLHFLREEYVKRRGLALRIKPWEVQSQRSQAIRAEQGFQLPEHTEAYRTFVIDLSFSEDEHWRSLKSRWRQEVNKCHRKHELVFEELHGPDSIDVFMKLYAEMSELKKFADFTDVQNLPLYFAELPEELRPHVLTCKRDGVVLAAIVCSVAGEFALAMFGATSTAGRECGASYFLNWNVVNWLRTRQGCLWYDLVGGTGDSGVRHFKQGLVGKCGALYEMWDYEFSDSKRNAIIVGLADRLRLAYQGFRLAQRNSA